VGVLQLIRECPAHVLAWGGGVFLPMILSKTFVRDLDPHDERGSN
jgi:hypothetical protein